jgi:putative hydrolase of the HAD superfamily
MPTIRKVIFFDLGNTLVQYCDNNEFPVFLEQGINLIRDYLYLNDLLQVSQEELIKRASIEDYENEDYRVRPLEQRLAQIFQLTTDVCSNELLMMLCKCFMTPFFSLARLYDDTISVLSHLASDSYRMAIVSNSLWGCPAELWREEIKHHGLDKWIGTTVFCRDVGWRKPAAQIYKYALERLRARAKDCLFVGDDLRWDFYGPREVGIPAVLLDRPGTMREITDDRIENLYQIFEMLNPPRGHKQLIR